VDLGAGIAVADGVDTLIGIERIRGSGYADTLRGDASDNTLEGGAGDDTLIGDAGRDTADYARSAHAVVVDLAAGTVAGDGADRLESIENSTGSAFDDLLHGDAGDNQLTGGAGDDTLIGAAGSDTLIGGEGDDVAVYASTSSAVDVDLSAGTAVHVSGTDHLQSIEIVVGTPWDDRLIGDGADNLLVGGGGNNVLIGGDGNDSTDYTWVDNGVQVNLATGTAHHDRGTDYLESIETVTGSAQDDVLRGDAAANALFGGAGDDTLAGGGGSDVLVGGDGIDIVDYADVGQGVSVDLAAGTALYGGATSRIETVERVDGSGYDDVLRGGDGTEALFGGGGNDTISGGHFLDGGAGDDVIRAETSVSFDWQPAADVLSQRTVGGWVYHWYSGSYTETFSSTANGQVTFENVSSSAPFAALSSALQVSPTTAVAPPTGMTVVAGERQAAWSWDPSTASLDPHGSGTWRYGPGNPEVGISYWEEVTLNLSSVETSQHLEGEFSGDYQDQAEVGRWVLHPDVHDATLLGGDGRDSLYGGQGADDLEGGADDDRLYGGLGDDTLVGDAGDDTLVGGNGRDQADYSGASQAITLDLGSHLATGDGIDELDGIEDVLGSAYDDALAGDDLANWIAAGDGDDRLLGDAGSDTLDGAVGDDNLEAGDGDDRLAGGDGDDRLLGGAGADMLDGGDGDDRLLGGAGDDTLIGGDGDDVFVFAADCGRDLIEDFEVGCDLLRISRIGRASGPASSYDIAARIHSDQDGNAVIDLGSGDSILLLGIAAEDLVADPEAFVQLV
jgi:Ca2+-binding RTX toxin-like protein